MESLRPTSVVRPVSRQICDWVDCTGGRGRGRDSASIVVDVETIGATAGLGVVARAWHVAVRSRSGSTRALDGGAAPTFRRIFGTSHGITGVVAGRGTALHRVAGNCDGEWKCPTTDDIADGEEVRKD